MATDDVLLRVLAETSSARREVDSLRAAFETALGRMEAAAKRPDFDPLSAEARQLRAQVDATGKAFITAFNKADKEVKETERRLDAARTGVRRLDAELNRLGKSGAGSVSGLAATIGELRSALAAVGGVAIAQRVGASVGRFIGDLAGEVQVARIELDSLRAQMDAAAGSSEAGGRAFDFARGKALELGFGLQDTIRAYAQFEAATRQTNLSTQQRREIFEATIEAGRVLQLSQQDINSALVALGQIAGKGKVSMEELRQQLGERLPGVLPILAKQLGITVAELDKMVSSGKLLADDALPALARGLRETFGSGLVAALETDVAALGRLRTQLVLLKAEAAEGFAKETSAGIEAVASAAEDAGPAARAAGEGFSYLLKSVLAIPLRAVADDLGLLVKTLELLGLREASIVTGAQSAALANDDLSNSLVGMTPVLREAEDVFRGYANQIDSTAEALKREKEGDEAAAAAIQETIRLAREKVPALKAAAEASKGAAEEEDKRKTVEEQVAEALARSAKEQEEFNRKLFESSGATFKSAEELDKLKVRIINAVDSLVILGATSVEQTDKALDFALKVAAGYRAMGEAVPVELVETIDRLAAASVEGAQKVVKALTEEAEAYAALGEAIPPELLARIERLTEITEDHTRAVALSVLGMREFREELFGSGADIETRAAQIVKLVDSLGLLGPATAEQSEIIKEEIQEQLDAYAELGEKPPLDLQRIADRFDVVTSRIEEQRKALKALTDDFAGLADKIKSSRADSGLAKDLAEQRAELAKLEGAAGQGPISIDQLNRIDDLKKSISRLEGEVEGLGTNFDTFGDQATASIEDVDAAIRDLIRGNQEALAGLPAATQDAIFNVLGGLQSAAVQGTATQEIIRDAMLKIGDQLQIAGVDTADFAQAMEDASGSGLNLTQELSKLQLGTGEAADAMGDYKKAAEEANKEQEAGVEKAKELGKAMKEAADAVVSEAGRMKPVLLDIDDILGRIVVKCENWKSCLAGAA